LAAQPRDEVVVIRLIVAAIVILVFVGQCRRPRGWIGRFMTATMNRSHSGVTDWGLGFVSIGNHASVLDVGCGGGRTIQKLAAATDGRVCGVDHSAASVATSRRTNALAIAAGRVEILQASVSRLPFPDATFDLVTAVETHYYWPNLIADLSEVRRVLKPGGAALIIAEAYRRRAAAAAVVGPVMRLLGGSYLTADEHRHAFVSAGFHDVVIEEQRGKGWICARGRS
jgi:SAM-dependent methyltransferase